MSSTTASVIVNTGDDFLVRQRGELNARRRSYREQVGRLSSAIAELAKAGAAPDLGDAEEFAEAPHPGGPAGGSAGGDAVRGMCQRLGPAPEVAPNVH